ncbi:MAG: glycoside hydrolase family 3 N-terminal domain-containing protein [Rubrimonas sp.]
MNDEAAIDALLARMTLEEKIGQLNLLPAGEGLATGAGGPSRLAERLDRGLVGAVFGVKSRASARALQQRALAGSRLGIPLFFAEDVIHGHRTVFPLPIALACSWDMALVEACAAHSAREAREDGIHQVYAPMIDIARDARWGRIAESPGEDPVLASAYATAFVRGLQGPDFAGEGRVAACLKHFVGYGAPRSGRDYDNASIDPAELFGVFLPPFRAGVQAGAASVMVAFNAINGTPMHAHEGLVAGWLRQACGFEGLVVSDYTGVMELRAHGLGGRAATVARAMRAGVDMDMVGEDYLEALPALAANGLDCAESGVRITAEEVVALVDASCRRVLRFKARLGLLDDPLRGLRGPGPDRAPGPDGRALARRAAAGSAVLLKNDGVLPLRPDARVALIGPLADDRANLIGTWSVSGDHAQVRTIREGLSQRPDLRLRCVRGADIEDRDWLIDRLNCHGVTVTRDGRPAAEMIAEALEAALWADVVVAVVGEAREHAGESSSRLQTDLPAPQRALVEALAATGRPLATVVCAGRPLALATETALSGALLYAWHGGVEAGSGIADLLCGEAEPTGRLAAALPAHPGQTPLAHAFEATGRPSPSRFQKFRTGWLDLPDAADPCGGLFPFGFGLGYAQVRYGDPDADRTEAAGEDDRLRVWVDVTNAGDRPTIETVQLYLSDPVARVTHPERTLAAFRRVALAPGATERVVFEIDVDMLRYPIADDLSSERRVWDPGAFILRLGPNSRDARPLEITWRA